MTFDRFLAIRFPFKATTWCTPRRARLTVIVGFNFSLVYSSPFLYTSGLANPRVCVAIKSHDLFPQVYSWVNTGLNSVVPFLSLLIMNAFIITTIRQRRKYFQESMKGKGVGDTKEMSMKKEREKKDTENAAEKAEKQQRFKENQLTVMLLLVTFMFLILTLPQYARYLVAAILDYDCDASTYAGYMFLVHLTNKLSFTNNACNFFLYCVGGSKFREDLKDVCKCGKKSKHATNSSLRSSSDGVNNPAFDNVDENIIT